MRVMSSCSNFRALKNTLTVCCVAMALALSGAAWAEKADRNKPMNIEADNLDHDELKQISIFSGKVVATKGTIVLRGARLEVRQDPDGFQYGILSAEPGRRAFFRQKREGVNEWIEGESERIEYDSKADRIVLLHKADLRRYRGTVLSDQMTGQRIVYENLSDQFTVDGQASGAKPHDNAPSGRVRAVLTPRNSDEAGK
ncbi:MAG: lipopolysaccharide transport periplasmic protein LptA [Pseudomonadota bacterium]|jgi:lipopolysaccharide export system protein LptA